MLDLDINIYILLIIAFIILIVILICYGLYDYIFYYPIKRRKDYNNIPSPGYDKYCENMKKEIEYMDSVNHDIVNINSYDGIQLKGYLYNNYKNRPFIIFFHGYRSCYQWDGYGIFRYCREKQINCLMVEQRAHGSSSSSTITFGLKERMDCLSWTEYMAKRFSGADLILAGVSMGSATVMMSANLKLPDSVRGIIADCGYTSPEEIIYNTARDRKLPGKILMPFAKLVLLLVAKVKLNDSSAIRSVANTNIPFLFIHGELDTFVPLHMGKTLFNVCSSPKEMLIVKNAVHAVSAMENFELYSEKINDFMVKVCGI